MIVFPVPEEVDAEAEENDDMQTLATDFELGHMLRDSIIPKAVLYYTGEAGDDDGEVTQNFAQQRRGKRSFRHV